MIEHLHKQIMGELESASSSDSLYVVGAVSFNFMDMAICWVTAGSSYILFRDWGATAIFVLLLLSVVVFTVLALQAMKNSEAMCAEYKAALVRIYEDHDVAKYLPKSMDLRSSESSRLRKTFVGLSGALAILIPLLEQFL